MRFLTAEDESIGSEFIDKAADPPGFGQDVAVGAYAICNTDTLHHFRCDQRLDLTVVST